MIEVGPFSSEKYNRTTFAEELLTYFKHGKKISPKYTRVYSEYKKLTDDETENAEVIQTTMDTLYEGVKSKHLASVIDISKRFFFENSLAFVAMDINQ